MTGISAGACPTRPFPIRRRWRRIGSRRRRRTGRPAAEQFALIEAASGALLGCAGLRLSQDRKSADLGYWLGRAAWGQGFGLEVARRLTEWAFAAMPIARITATVASDNDVSFAVLQRIGFTQTGKGTQALCAGRGKTAGAAFRRWSARCPVAVRNALPPCCSWWRWR